MPTLLYLVLKYIVSMPETAGRIPMARKQDICLRVRAKKNKAMPIKIEIAVSRKWAKVEKPAFLMKSVRASDMVKLTALSDKQFPELLARVTGQ